jgi:3'-5' exoribonuclease
MKLSECTVNSFCTIPLVVLSAQARETKAKKPYLTLELFDGIDTINGNYWDWGGKVIPEQNVILDVEAQVTEWLGTKQLTIKKLSNNTTLHLNDFTPRSTVDVAATYLEAYTLASDISDDFLRPLCQGILEDFNNLWLTIPGAKTVHHAYLAGTLIHSVSTTKIAIAMAKASAANVALVTAGALLHDVGKLFSYKIDGLVCDMTDDGMLFDHLFLGAEFVNNYAIENIQPVELNKLELLRHIILSHHGKQEYGAVVQPILLEAYVVYLADTLDANAEQLREASGKAGKAKFTEKLWAMGSKPHINVEYVKEVMLR